MADSVTNTTAGTTGTAERIETLDQVERRRNHPLYLHNSNTPGSILTSIQLTGTENYSLWSRSMLINLRAKSKLGFILGTCKRCDYKGKMEEQWEKCNAFVLAWIMNTVSKDLLSSIAYTTDAAVVWADLKERFDKVDGSRSYQLHREICTISQGSMSVSAYFSKLRLLWDEFDALVPPPSCSCDNSKTYIDHLSGLKLFAFLMGLSETYAHARSQILMMTPLPSVSKAYAMIMADEGQRQTANLHLGGASEQIALYAGKGQSPSQFPRRFQPRKKNWDQVCEFCKIKGHVKAECYKLHGYPPDWKFKQKQSGANTRRQDGANQVIGAKDDIDLADAFAPIAADMKGKITADSSPFMSTQPMFTPTQHNRILHLLEREAADTVQALHQSIWLIWQDLFSREVKGIDKESGGLYHLPATLQCEEAKESSMVMMTKGSSTEQLLWHSRFGHPSLTVLKHLLMDRHINVSDDCNKCLIVPLQNKLDCLFL